MRYHKQSNASPTTQSCMLIFSNTHEHTLANLRKTYRNKYSNTHKEKHEP